MTSYVLAIDQGTTSSRAILFRADTSIAAVAQQEFPQHFPADGQVEHEPEDLWRTTVETCRSAMRSAGATARDIAAIGITNQRETTLLWERASGRAGASRDRMAGPANRRCVRAAADRRPRSRSSRPRPDCCSIPISPEPNSRGSWTTPQMRATRRRAANSLLGRSIRICCGVSPAARCTPPTPQTRRARCCTTSMQGAGTMSCWRCSASLKTFCRTSSIHPPPSAPPTRSCSAPQFPFAASPATNKPP